MSSSAELYSDTISEILFRFKCKYKIDADVIIRKKKRNNRYAEVLVTIYKVFLPCFLEKVCVSINSPMLVSYNIKANLGFFKAGK